MEKRYRNILDCDHIKFKNPSVLIQKIISLIEQQITKNDFKRQREYIDKLLVVCDTGFFMRDLHNLMSLFEMLLERIEEVHEYTNFLHKLLQICGIPPIMTLSSDILTFSRSFQEYFAMLGYILASVKIENLQTITANALISLLTKNYESRNYISLQARINCVLCSPLLEILGQLLILANEEVYPSILNVISILVKESDKACKILIEEDALNYLLMRLEPTWKERFPDKPPPAVPKENVLHYDKVAIILLILLRYMANNVKHLKTVQNIRLFSLWSLQYAFRWFARHNQALNRNNILIILLKIIHLFPKLNFVSCGLARDLTFIGLNSGYAKSWAKDIKLSSDDDDCLYLELLISALPVYLNFFGGIRVLEEQRIVYQLLAISRNKYAIKWNPQQVCVLSHIALDALMKIVPCTEEEFIENGGPTIFLNIIQLYKTNNIDILILKKCLEALLQILKNTIMVPDSVIFNDGLNLIQDLCEDILSNSFEDNFGKKCLSLVFFILDILYKHSKTHNTKMITITTTYMKKIVSHHQEISVRDIREIICVLNFIWEHIVKTEKYAHEFVKKDGAFLLLDMTQKFPFVVKVVALGALVDLCEYGRTVPYLITWKRNGQTILPMLMKLFRDENEQLRVKTGQLGQISDIRYPLMGKDQWFLTFCTCKPMTPGNACISDLFVSCRPKVYALLHTLHKKYAEETQIANEHYKLYDEELQPMDQISRLMAENFLALKLGEAWVELKEEFDRSSISLTSLDDKILSSLTTRAAKLARYLQTVQNEIVQNTNEKELLQEYKLYMYLGEGKLTDALEALSELKGIARSSEHMFRISEKYKQNKQIDDAVKSHSMEVHRTYFSDIRVTPVFNQIVKLTNNNTPAEEMDIIPVSPTETENHCIDIAEDLLQSEINFDL